MQRAGHLTSIILGDALLEMEAGEHRVTQLAEYSWSEDNLVRFDSKTSAASTGAGLQGLSVQGLCMFFQCAVRSNERLQANQVEISLMSDFTT